MPRSKSLKAFPLSPALKSLHQRMDTYGLHWAMVLSTLLTALAFQPWDFSFFIWFSLTPWFWVLHRTPTPRKAFLRGVWLSVLWTVFGFSWVTYSLHQFGQVPWPLCIVMLLLLGTFCQPQHLIFSPLWWLIHRKKKLSEQSLSRSLLTALTLSLLYTGLDAFVPKMFHDTLGHTQYLATHIRQLADLGGTHLITFLIVLFNYSVWLLLEEFIEKRRRFKALGTHAIAPVLLSSCLLILASLYGYFRNSTVQEAIRSPRSTVQLAAIQANIGDFDKVAAESGVRGAVFRIIRSYTSLSDQALQLKPQPEAIIWPETAYPSTYRTPVTRLEILMDRRVSSWVKTRDVPLWFGGYDKDPLIGKDFNSLFFLYPQPRTDIQPGYPNEANDLEIYHKHILLLFGEYIPGADTFPFIKKLFPQVGHFGRGPGPETFNAKTSRNRIIRVSPMICYEALFPDFAIQAARQGSELFLNITNDSWFGPWAEPHQHLAQTVFRSIETRIPQLRSTNTGITTLIYPDGTMDRQTELFVPDIYNVTVPLIRPISTLMIELGDWFGGMSLFLGFLFLMGFEIQARRKR